MNKLLKFKKDELTTKEQLKINGGDRRRVRKTDIALRRRRSTG